MEDSRFVLDFRKIHDKKHYKTYEFDRFTEAEEVFNILSLYEVQLKLAEAQVKSLQYTCDLLNTKLNIVDDLIIQQIKEYGDNSYTPAGSTQTITANNKIEALKLLKEAIPISDLHSRNKVDGLFKLRKDLGLMSDEECSEWKKMEWGERKNDKH